MNATFQALAREAGLAAEHLAIGVTALGKANYAQQSYYYQAFFALSIGLERSAKLAIIVDYALDNHGSFPSWETIKKKSHRISQLLKEVQTVAQQRGWQEPSLPSSSIHKGIISVLSEFASNNRYYALDYLCGKPNIGQQADPVEAWFSSVTVPILQSHYNARLEQTHLAKAMAIDAIMGPFSLVRHHSETGRDLDNLYATSLQLSQTDFAKPYTRMYVLQIARFIGYVLSQLSREPMARQLDSIPELSEFYAIFNNTDDYFKRRKVWSIHRV